MEYKLKSYSIVSIVKYTAHASSLGRWSLCPFFYGFTSSFLLSTNGTKHPFSSRTELLHLNSESHLT